MTGWRKRALILAKSGHDLANCSFPDCTDWYARRERQFQVSKHRWLN